MKELYAEQQNEISQLVMVVNDARATAVAITQAAGGSVLVTDAIRQDVASGKFAGLETKESKSPKGIKYIVVEAEETEEEPDVEAP